MLGKELGWGRGCDNGPGFECSDAKPNEWLGGLGVDVITFLDLRILFSAHIFTTWAFQDLASFKKPWVKMCFTILGTPSTFWGLIRWQWVGVPMTHAPKSSGPRQSSGMSCWTRIPRGAPAFTANQRIVLWGSYAYYCANPSSCILMSTTCSPKRSLQIHRKKNSGPKC